MRPNVWAQTFGPTWMGPLERMGGATGTIPGTVPGTDLLAEGSMASRERIAVSFTPKQAAFLASCLKTEQRDRGETLTAEEFLGEWADELDALEAKQSPDAEWPLPCVHHLKVVSALAACSRSVGDGRPPLAGPRLSGAWARCSAVPH